MAKMNECHFRRACTFLIQIIPNSHRKLKRRSIMFSSDASSSTSTQEHLRAWCSNPLLIPLVRATAGRKLWWGCISGCRTKAAKAAFSREARARVNRLEKEKRSKGKGYRPEGSICTAAWVTKSCSESGIGCSELVRLVMTNGSICGILETLVSSRAAVSVRNEYLVNDPGSILLVHWHYNYLSLAGRILFHGWIYTYIR